MTARKYILHVIRWGDNDDYVLGAELGRNYDGGELSVSYELGKPGVHSIGVATWWGGSNPVGILIGEVYVIKDKVIFGSRGTFVSKRHRRQGLALKLWSRLIRELQPDTIQVNIISDSGLTLIESLKQRFPRIKFDVAESGGRPLRLLKKGRAA